MTPKEKIEKFIRIIEKVEASTFAQKTKKISYNLNVKMGEPSSQTISGADIEYMRSMLIDLRKITLEKDKVGLVNVCNVLIKETKNPEIGEKLKEWKTVYQAFLVGPPAVPLDINGKIDTVEEILEKWFYGDYFHEENEYRVSLESLDFGKPIYQYNLIIAVTTLMQIAIGIPNLAKEGLEEN